MRLRGFLAATLISFSTPSLAESVSVKYEGSIDLGTSQCQTNTRSSFVNRVCYDAVARSMIVLLKATYYEYCRVPQTVINAFYVAKSMGHFYNTTIKSNAVDGAYDCRK